MRTRLTRLAALLGAFAALAVGGATLASAGSGSPAVKSRPAARHITSAAQRSTAEDPNKGEKQTEGQPTAESDTDAAAQAAACQKAGIDPNGNVQYDDQSGMCSLDTGGNSDVGGNVNR